MKTLKTKFKDMIICQTKNFYDHRGFFRELFIEKKIKKRLIFTVLSKSKKNVLRGMHIQKKNQQGKYVSVIKKNPKFLNFLGQNFWFSRLY